MKNYQFLCYYPRYTCGEPEVKYNQCEQVFQITNLNCFDEDFHSSLRDSEFVFSSIQSNFKL